MKSKGYRNPANKNQETPVHRYLTTVFGRYYGSRVKVKNLVDVKVILAKEVLYVTQNIDRS
jgi:hypothetical protein